jgi:hypothetical protein
MNSKDQFAGLEVMCRERAALAKKEMEYWLAEAEEWKQLRESPDPFAERRITPTVGCPGSSIGSTQRHHRKERDYTPTELVAVANPRGFARTGSTGTPRKIGMRQ